MRRSVASMVSAAVDPDDSWLLHLLAIFGAIFLANATIPGTIKIEEA
jgi:hypothetical protein